MIFNHRWEGWWLVLMISFIKRTHLHIYIMTHGKHIQMVIYNELAAELLVDPQAHPQHSSTKFNLHSNKLYLTFFFWLNSFKKKILSHYHRMNSTFSGVQAASQRLFTGTYIDFCPPQEFPCKLDSNICDYGSIYRRWFCILNRKYCSWMQNGVLCCMVVNVLQRMCPLVWLVLHGWQKNINMVTAVFRMESSPLCNLWSTFSICCLFLNT